LVPNAEKKTLKTTKSIAPDRPYVSIVVPVYNERENVPLLYRSIRNVLDGLHRHYEIILVDDGSRDGTREVLRKIAGGDIRVKAVLFRRNFGQSAAMAAGFRLCRGEKVVTMDGDNQNDPRDIPSLLSKIDEGFDVVSGWRVHRQDKLVFRKVPSKIANRLICSMTGVRLHDTGCSLKAFRREVIDRIRLYGELHRFLPGLARVEGARITEMAVRHHARKFGTSKYNLSRTFRVLMDLSTLNLFIKYLKNPLRYFGKFGILCFAAALAGTGWIAWKSAGLGQPLSGFNVPTTLVFLLWTMGFQFIFLGLIAALIVRTGLRRGGTLQPIQPHERKGPRN
jgi:glycosyltransferase involved in cell wall biosynthesis